jgi:transposase InsO family protein
VALLAAKSEAAGAMALTEECGRKLRVLRTDNGEEFTTAEFAAYCAEVGVMRHFSTPYTS